MQLDADGVGVSGNEYYFVFIKNSYFMYFKYFKNSLAYIIFFCDKLFSINKYLLMVINVNLHRKVKVEISIAFSYVCSLQNINFC